MAQGGFKMGLSVLKVPKGVQGGHKGSKGVLRELDGI